MLAFRNPGAVVKNVSVGELEKLIIMDDKSGTVESGEPRFLGLLVAGESIL